MWSTNISSRRLRSSQSLDFGIGDISSEAREAIYSAVASTTLEMPVLGVFALGCGAYPEPVCHGYEVESSRREVDLACASPQKRHDLYCKNSCVKYRCWQQLQTLLESSND